METTKQSLKNKTTTSFIWKFAERCGAQGVSFIVSVVLARLLAPEDYGSIALITVFINILQVFVDSGMGTALIQKQNADDLDFSTVFYFNVFICTVIYTITYALAPFVARFYKDESLTSVIRVLCLTIVISGVKNIQHSYISKKMIFKKFFYATLGGTIGAAVVGITMAYLGFGIWALVAQQLFNTTVDTIILWVTVKWRPKRMFSMNRLAELYSYGWKMVVSALIANVYLNIQSLIIGVKYSTVDLAYYNKGKAFPALVTNNANNAIDSVMLPVFAFKQDDLSKVKQMLRKTIKMISYIVWPMVFGMFATANSIISIFLTDKWLPCVPFLYLFCLMQGLEPLNAVNLNAIKALGNSDIFLKIEIIKKIIGIIIIVITMQMGVMAMTYGLLATCILSFFINAYPNKRLLDYSIQELLKDIAPSIVMAIIMCIIVMCFNRLQCNTILLFIIQIFVGVVSYVVLSKIFKIEEMSYLIEIIQRKIKKRKNKPINK